MKFLDLLGLSPPERRSSPLENPAVPLASPFSWFIGAGFTDSAEIVNPATATAIATVNACVRALSSAISSLPLKLYRVAENGRKAEDITSPLHRLLALQPNEFTTADLFWVSTMNALLLTGNSFAEIVWNSATGVPASVWFIQPEYVSVQRLPNGTVTYTVTTNGKARTVAPENILHFRSDFSADGVTGISPVAQVRNLLGTALAMERYNATFFANSATPSGILKTSKVVKPEDKTKMRQAWEDQQSGSNRHKVAVLDQELDFEPLATSNADAQSVETTKLIRSQICGLFRMSPWMIGSEERTSSEVFSGQQLSFLVDVLRPWMNRTLQELTIKMLRGRPDLVIDYDVSDRTRLDQKQMVDSFSTARSFGILSGNECRLMMGKDPVEGNDDLWRPVNMVPINTPVQQVQTGNGGQNNEKPI